MDDEEFLEALQEHRFPPSEFSHKGHLRLSWIILRRYGYSEGSAIVSNTIKDFAASKGALNKYHETLTQFWLRIIYHTSETSPNIYNFGEFLNNFPFLLDKGLPLKHWQPDTIQRQDSSIAWVEPDLAPLPALHN